MLKKLITPTIALALAAAPALAGTISVAGTAPTIDDADIAMLNVAGQYDTGGDEGHIWSNRPIHGQTFTTGSNVLGYELSSITLRNFNNTNGGNSATWTVRVGTVSGTTFTPVSSETSNNTISYNPGDYLTFNQAGTINLMPNTVYGFDWDTSGSGFVTANNTDGNYTGGTAFSSGGAGVPDDANLTFSGDDRVFHVNLATNADSNEGFGVNFIGGRNIVGDDDGVIGSVDLAGAGDYAQRSWNEVAPRGTPNGSIAAGSVLDRQGNTIAGTTVAWAANNTWSTGNVAPASDDHALMKGYLDSNGTNGPDVTVSNVAIAQYDVVVYIDGDGGNNSPKGQYWLEDGSGNVISNKVFLDEDHGGSGQFAGTYIEADAYGNNTGNASGGNYLVFSGLTTTDFVLKGEQPSGGVRAPINGFQVFGTNVDAIGVNFQGGGATNGATTAMQAEEIAGVVSQSHWNNAADNGANATGGNQSGAINDLTDSFGDTTGVDIAWNVNNTWSNEGLGEAGDRRLMDGYLDNLHVGGTLTVSSIEYEAYDVIVYSNSDRPSGIAEFILNGTLSELLTEGSTFDGILEEGVDYVVFRNISGSSFTLTANQFSGNPAAAINGIQIVAIPTPAALPAGLAAIAIIVGRRRRR